MYWNHYDKATGDTPRIGDRVENCHTGDKLEDGVFKGVFAGWASQDFISGIVILDKPASSGELAVTMPIVCLRMIKNSIEPIEPVNIPRQKPLTRY